MNPPLQMRELNVSNDLLGDRAALQAAWDRDGYWFFRDVLDKDVIARIRGIYADYLAGLGLADREDPAIRYNGGDLSKLPNQANASPLNIAHVERELHEAPTVNAFFKKLFGCDPFWVPFTVHRTVPPALDRSLPRLEFIHHDGIYNDGLPFLICWVPMDVIDEDVGGLGVVEGLQNQPTLHRKEGMTIHPIRLEDVPEGAWLHTTSRPGDVLLMSMGTPHSGITNWSKDRFRLSMDTRIMPSSGKVPLVGTLTAVSAEKVTIRDARGDHELRLDEKSFVRGTLGDQMPIAEIPKRYKPGNAVIAAFDDGRVVNMRPQS